MVKIGNQEVDIDDVMCRQTELTVSGWNRELTDEELSELYRLDKILKKYNNQKNIENKIDVQERQSRRKR
jgi:hypothetical protein